MVLKSLLKKSQTWGLVSHGRKTSQESQDDSLMLDGERKRGWTSPVQLSTFSDWIVWQSLGKWRGRSLLHLQGDTSREISKLQQKWKQLEIYEGHLLDLHFTVWSTGRFIIHQTLEIFSEKKAIINMKNEDDMCASIDAFQEPLNLLIKSWEDQRT